MQTHFWNKNTQGMLHLVESEELSDHFGAKEAVFVGDHFSGCGQAQWLDVLGCTTEGGFLLCFQGFDHLGAQLGFQVVDEPFLDHGLDDSVFRFLGDLSCHC